MNKLLVTFFFRNCCCGKIQAQVKCSSKAVLTCESICDKILNCGVHTCKKQCHIGPCKLCTVTLKLGKFNLSKLIPLNM
jgi:hypothetical protein